MSKATYPLKLPVSIKKAAQRLAQEDGVSLNQGIASAVAQKVGVVETAADFVQNKAGRTTGAGLARFLRSAPTVELWKPCVASNLPSLCAVEKWPKMLASKKKLHFSHKPKYYDLRGLLYFPNTALYYR
jgi:hypothetical protein